MPAQGIVADALNGLLDIMPLGAVYGVAAAAAVDGTTKTTKSMPHACAVVLTPTACTAGKTLDLAVWGKNKAADAWVLVGTFAQVTNAAQGIQRLNVAAPYKMYKTIHTIAGTAFAGTDTVAWACHLVGTNAKFAPIVQVD